MQINMTREKLYKMAAMTTFEHRGQTSFMLDTLKLMTGRADADQVFVALDPGEFDLEWRLQEMQRFDRASWANQLETIFVASSWFNHPAMPMSYHQKVGSLSMQQAFKAMNDAILYAAPIKGNITPIVARFHATGGKGFADLMKQHMRSRGMNDDVLRHLCKFSCMILEKMGADVKAANPPQFAGVTQELFDILKNEEENRLYDFTITPDAEDHARAMDRAAGATAVIQTALLGLSNYHTNGDAIPMRALRVDIIGNEAMKAICDAHDPGLKMDLYNLCHALDEQARHQKYEKIGVEGLHGRLLEATRSFIKNVRPEEPSETPSL